MARRSDVASVCRSWVIHTYLLFILMQSQLHMMIPLLQLCEMQIGAKAACVCELLHFTTALGLRTLHDVLDISGSFKSSESRLDTLQLCMTQQLRLMLLYLRGNVLRKGARGMIRWLSNVSSLTRARSRLSSMRGGRRMTPMRKGRNRLCVPKGGYVKNQAPHIIS
jgi:hypothetical protein